MLNNLHFAAGGNASRATVWPRFLAVLNQHLRDHYTMQTTPIPEAAMRTHDDVQKPQCRASLASALAALVAVAAFSGGTVQARADTNSAPVVTITAPDPTAAEALNPNGTTNTGAFQITRTGDTQTSLTVWVTVSGTAIYGVDYRFAPAFSMAPSGPSEVFLPAHTNALTILVVPIDDHLAKLDETVVLTLFTNSSLGYSAGQPSTATVTIVANNDPNRPPTAAMLYPTNGARFPSGKNIQLVANVFDADANAQTVEFFADGVSQGVVNISNTITDPDAYRTTNFNQVVGLVVPTLSPGTHLVTARVTDLFGAQATASPFSITVLAPVSHPPLAPALGAEPNSVFSYLLDANGALYVWVAPAADQPGVKSAIVQPLPVQVALPDGATAWSQVAGGQSHTLAIANNGQLYAWGFNESGQLGSGSATNSSFQLLPVQVPAPPAVTGWRKAAGGSSFSLAIANNGQLYGWGNGGFGQLGNGSYGYHYRPALVPFPVGVTNWVDVAAGSEHSLALSDKGAVYGWGNNSEGAVGNASLTNCIPSPVPVLLPGGVSGAIQVAAGTWHSFALAMTAAFTAGA